MFVSPQQSWPFCYYPTRKSFPRLCFAGWKCCVSHPTAQHFGDDGSRENRGASALPGAVGLWFGFGWKGASSSSLNKRRSVPDHVEHPFASSLGYLPPSCAPAVLTVAVSPQPDPTGVSPVTMAGSACGDMKSNVRSSRAFSESLKCSTWG